MSGQSATADTVIATDALTKRFGGVCAVDGIDLDVREGDLYGFLGANGSGKTTTVRMLLGLVLATSGSIEVLGRPVPRAAADVLAQVGALVEGPAAYDHLSGRANLMLFDAMGPRPPGTPQGRRERSRRTDSVLEQVGLGVAGRRSVGGYSLGMRQRLGLAAALLRRPRLLVLDEPTNGLDPQGIHEIRDLLVSLAADGTTIFLSSHLLAEVEQMCNRVGVLDRGRLVVQDRLDAVCGATGRCVLVTVDVEAARRLLGDRVTSLEGERLVVTAPDPGSLAVELVEAGVRLTSLAPERRGLEQVVLEATADPHTVGDSR